MNEPRRPDEQHPDLRRLAARPVSRTADLIGKIFDPLVLTSALLLAVGAAGHPNPWVGVGWAVLALVGCAILPELVLRALVRSGRAGDRQLVRREQRRIPMLVAAACVAVVAVLLTTSGAPRLLSATVWTVLAGVAVMTAVTQLWKASIHAAVAATTATVTALVLGPRTLLAGVAVCLVVAWARVRAGRHSAAQVVGGIALGVLVTLLVFPTLR